MAIPEEAILTEKAFFDWLISDGGVSDTTAKQYISNIHSIEKLYQTLFGVRKNLLGVNSADNAKTMIEILLQRSEYIDANERRHNSFGISLSKFAQFADISVVGLKNTAEKKNYQPPISTQPYVIKTVDFENFHNCTYCKPCSFILNEVKHSVGSWRELYTKFLYLLYTDNNYIDILKGLIGKSLYGHRTDFADKTLVHKLRRAIRISPNFFAESNLSAIDIIKHIKCLIELCSIDDDHMRIEYITQEKDNESVISDDNDNTGADSKIETHDSTSLEILKLPVNIAEKSDSDRFTEWLINVSGLAPDTAKSYYSSVKTSERIAREQNLRSQRLLSVHSYSEANETFNELLRCEAFIKMNATAHNSLTAGVRKLLQYLQSTMNSEPEETIQLVPYSVKENTTPAVTHFAPDTSKPFVLKDAVIEILSSNAPEITKYHEHKDGISSKNLRELIKAYYGKTIGLFEISKLLMLDKTFQSVGKGCYIVNEAAIPHSEPEPEFTENDEPVEIVAKPVRTPEPIIDHKVPTVAELVKTMTEPISTATQPAIHEETMADDTIDIETNDILTIEPIIAVIKENYDNLQYEDGFGAYEVKTLLSQKGYTNASEDEIEALMTECSELQEIEDGYYTLAEIEDNTETSVEVSAIAKDNTEDTKTEVVEAPITVITPEEPQEVAADTRYIVLRLNGNVIRAYDYSDALNKVCEFCINCQPFRMARIAGQAIQLHGNNVFYRKTVPVDGYNKMSNGLQLITIDSLSDLQTITVAVQKYCQIDDDMIAIISQ